MQVEENNSSITRVRLLNFMYIQCNKWSKILCFTTQTTRPVFPLFSIFCQLLLCLSQLYLDHRPGWHHSKVCPHKQTAATRGLRSLMAEEILDVKGLLSCNYFEENEQLKRWSELDKYWINQRRNLFLPCRSFPSLPLLYCLIWYHQLGKHPSKISLLMMRNLDQILEFWSCEVVL